MGSGILEGIGLATTILRVRSVEESVAWYRKNLGLEPAWVGRDGPEHPVAAYVVAGALVSLWQLPPGERRDAADNDRNSYVIFVTDRDPADLHAELAARGVRVDPLRSSANARFFWFYDPDDNRFEVSRVTTEEFAGAADRVRTALRA